MHEAESASSPDEQAPPSDPAPQPGALSPQEYWRRNICCVLSLLAVWFLVSYGCGILWADGLDKIRTPGGGIKLGFWFAQQGSIYVFVVLIAIYVRYMNRLDAEYSGSKS